MSDDAATIAQTIIDRMDDAWENEGSVPGDILTDDAVYTNMGGSFFRGRTAIVEGTRLVKQRFQTKVIGRELIEAQRLADGVVLALVVSNARSPVDGGYREFRGMQLYVIVRDDDAWRIAAYQNTRLPADATIAANGG